MNEITPGFYEIGIEDYHLDPCPSPSLNNSLISVFLQAPAKARNQHPKLNPLWRGTNSNRFDLGSAAHKLLLGRGREISVLEFDDYRKNDAKDARDAARAAGLIPILGKDFDIASAMETAARRQIKEFELAGAFGSEGRSEMALLWLDSSGAWGRNLIDWSTDDLTEIWDYKTTDRSARPEDPGLGVHVVSMGYDTQSAMQERGLTTLFPQLGGRIKFRLLFQETEPPYLISAVEPDAATMTMAHKKVDYAFNKFAECLKSGVWPGYTPKIVPLVHAGYLANRWLEREIAEFEGDGNELAPPVALPKRKPGRPKFSRNKKRILVPRVPNPFGAG
jgi:hypothetical protein